MVAPLACDCPMGKCHGKTGRVLRFSLCFSASHRHTSWPRPSSPSTVVRHQRPGWFSPRREQNAGEKGVGKGLGLRASFFEPTPVDYISTNQILCLFFLCLSDSPIPVSWTLHFTFSSLVSSLPSLPDMDLIRQTPSFSYGPEFLHDLSTFLLVSS